MPAEDTATASTSPALGLVALVGAFAVGCVAVAALTTDAAGSSLPAIFLGVAALSAFVGFGRNETWSQVLGFVAGVALAFVVINTGGTPELGRVMDRLGSPVADAISGEGG